VNDNSASDLVAVHDKTRYPFVCATSRACAPERRFTNARIALQKEDVRLPFREFEKRRNLGQLAVPADDRGHSPRMRLLFAR
jgi:hypothetical protein